MIKAAHKLLKEKIEISKGNHQVLVSIGENIVRVFRRPGRTLISCSCEHGSKFNNSPVLCKHRLAAIFKLMGGENGSS